MKLKDFLKYINTIVEEHPEALEYDVIYSRDDEGNNFNKIVFAPNIGNFNGEDFDEGAEVNSICIN